MWKCGTFQTYLLKRGPFYIESCKNISHKSDKEESKLYWNQDQPRKRLLLVKIQAKMYCLVNPTNEKDFWSYWFQYKNPDRKFRNSPAVVKYFYITHAAELGESLYFSSTLWIRLISIFCDKTFYYKGSVYGKFLDTEPYSYGLKNRSQLDALCKKQPLEYHPAV